MKLVIHCCIVVLFQMIAALLYFAVFSFDTFHNYLVLSAFIKIGSLNISFLRLTWVIYALVILYVKRLPTLLKGFRFLCNWSIKFSFCCTSAAIKWISKLHLIFFLCFRTNMKAFFKPHASSTIFGYKYIISICFIFIAFKPILFGPIFTPDFNRGGEETNCSPQLKAKWNAVQA